MEEALSDEVARAVLREVTRLPGRYRRIVFGIVWQFKQERDVSDSR